MGKGRMLQGQGHFSSSSSFFCQFSSHQNMGRRMRKKKKKLAVDMDGLRVKFDMREFLSLFFYIHHLRPEKVITTSFCNCNIYFLSQSFFLNFMLSSLYFRQTQPPTVACKM